MAQSALLHQELKRALRDARVTYAEVAASLKLSEASVKRLFSKEALSLRRLESVCHMIGIEISDLVERVETRREYITALTPEQEEALVSDPKLLLMTFQVINGQSVEGICATYRVSKSEAQRILIEMDRLKIIQLLPFNKIRRLTARNFSWRKDGPVQRFFARQIQSEFFSSAFDGPDDELKFIAARLSRASIAKVQLSLDRVARELDELARLDAALPHAERKACSAVLAIRTWEPTIFSQLRRDA